MCTNQSKFLAFFTKAFLIVSILLCIIITYIIIDNMVSLKYEIDEDPKGIISKEWARGYLTSKISCLKYFICYILLTIVFVLFNQRNNRNLTNFEKKE